MALGESRRTAKLLLRGEHETGSPLGRSSGKIHSYQTRSTYQEQVLLFLNWVRDQYGIRRLEAVDLQADALACAYLQARIAQGSSPWTLQTIRSALRLFFSQKTLAAAVALPPRRRELITRSRGPVAQDQDMQEANWHPLIGFLKASGLRRKEVRALLVREVWADQHGQVWLYVRQGKGGRARTVPILPGAEENVLSLTAGRSPDERLFPRIPAHLDIHALRRAYAQALYLALAPAGTCLPLPTGKLRPQDYDVPAVQRVSWALGHNRLDVVLTHYLR